MQVSEELLSLKGGDYLQELNTQDVLCILLDHGKTVIPCSG